MSIAAFSGAISANPRERPSAVHDDSSASAHVSCRGRRTGILSRKCKCLSLHTASQRLPKIARKALHAKSGISRKVAA
eukprot:5023180-Prymnesium_polylepis.1